MDKKITIIMIIITLILSFLNISVRHSINTYNSNLYLTEYDELTSQAVEQDKNSIKPMAITATIILLLITLVILSIYQIKSQHEFINIICAIILIFCSTIGLRFNLMILGKYGLAHTIISITTLVSMIYIPLNLVIAVIQKFMAKKKEIK